MASKKNKTTPKKTKRVDHSHKGLDWDDILKNQKLHETHTQAALARFCGVSPSAVRNAMRVRGLV